MEDSRWSESAALIRSAWDNPEQRNNPAVVETVAKVLDALDAGEIRVAEKADGRWAVNDWVKEAVLLYFVHREVEVVEHGPFEYRDKIPLKHGFEQASVRAVPPATVRHGAYLGHDVVLMPSYINIGAYVGDGTLIDTWATVGSCAQVGKGVHISGGVGLGGVLEPVQASPVIIEDGVFVGSRCIVVEGVVVEEEAVLGAGVVLTASTAVVDVTGDEPKEFRGRVPAHSVVIPGMRSKEFPAGTYSIPSALIIGRRRESTDKKTSLNEVLRQYGIPT
jgi:2,3,4,5-tetrahydropyridine-2-carboxylate N-succinyltransferase